MPKKGQGVNDKIELITPPFPSAECIQHQFRVLKNQAQKIEFHTPPKLIACTPFPSIDAPKRVPKLIRCMEFKIEFHTPISECWNASSINFRELKNQASETHSPTPIPSGPNHQGTHFPLGKLGMLILLVVLLVQQVNGFRGQNDQRFGSEYLFRKTNPTGGVGWVLTAMDVIHICDID